MNAPVRPTTRQPELLPPCSLRNHSIAGESIARSACSGASRKSSACAVGGVSMTIRSQAPVASSSCSLAIAAYSWAPASVPEIWP